jgi:hypothetical protein
VANKAALVQALLRDFPEMRFGYHASGSDDEDLRHLVRHMAGITNELAAKEPGSDGICKAFEWQRRLAEDEATAGLAALFTAHLGPLALTFAPGR